MSDDLLTTSLYPTTAVVSTNEIDVSARDFVERITTIETADTIQSRQIVSALSNVYLIENVARDLSSGVGFQNEPSTSTDVILEIVRPPFV